jgi:hypothetical protein
VDGFKIVEVSWLDACASENNWLTMEEIADHTIIECVTVGFMTKDTDREIQVVQSLCGDDGGEAMSIPKGCVVSVKILREAKP